MYFDHANNYWVAAVSLGYKAGKRVRRKVTGRTKTEVKIKLRALRRDLDSGIRPRKCSNPTVRHRLCVTAKVLWPAPMTLIDRVAPGW